MEVVLEIPIEACNLKYGDEEGGWLPVLLEGDMERDCGRKL